MYHACSVLVLGRLWVGTLTNSSLVEKYAPSSLPRPWAQGCCPQHLRCGGRGTCGSRAGEQQLSPASAGGLWGWQGDSDPHSTLPNLLVQPCLHLSPRLQPFSQPKKLDISCPSGMTLLREGHAGAHQKKTIQQQNALQAFIISHFDC